MELTHLRYFCAIAEARHMTRAARKLGVTQPTLSSMLRKLEAEVGAPLFHRTGRGVELTDAGRVFLSHADDAVRRADGGLKAVRELLGLELGSIRIGGGASATTYILPPVVSDIRRQHPGLRFYIREAGSTTVAEAVLSGALDLGIVTLPITLPDASDLVRVPLVEDELLLIVPRGHTLAGKRAFAWKELADESVIGFEAGSAVRDVIDSAAARAGVSLRYVMELRSIEGIKHMVDAGIGVGFVSRFALADADGMRCREGKLARAMAIVKRRDRALSHAAAEFERALLRSVKRRPVAT
jgi:DNA-binding transcriptional LysR family regulator